ncbi:hypothetical protein [Rhizobium sp. LC145]|jgi:hypothetical protein|uniref:hypothetical protein n=1 Tax=Rhizobium sp. LC145 TaxID=1120688 RepID=UPI00062A486B|nr:hypothetical protein [Rhizobium sp. LC145]KKX24678.1 lipoprotein [Rhizobium sp. LC145]TKT42675.1 hypothetical protein FDR95_28230 [Rhizobiaceae bacterium LC148]
MKTTHAFRAGMGVAGILAATLTLSGCMGSPTYGTDKTAMEQLADDLGSAVSVGGNDDKRRSVKYNPRPSLVVATKEQQNQTLPSPQQSLAGRENNPNWVESPEETRERLRQEATENENNPRYRSPLLAGRGQAGQMTESQKWEAFRQARQNAETVNLSAPRRSLSDPPTEYRAADAANLQDVGEPELQKERRRKKEAEETAKTSSWWKPFQ